MCEADCASDRDCLNGTHCVASGRNRRRRRGRRSRAPSAAHGAPRRGQRQPGLVHRRVGCAARDHHVHLDVLVRRPDARAAGRRRRAPALRAKVRRRRLALVGSGGRRRGAEHLRRGRQPHPHTGPSAHAERTRRDRGGRGGAGRAGCTGAGAVVVRGLLLGWDR
jgi:hypothetical protein